MLKITGDFQHKASRQLVIFTVNDSPRTAGTTSPICRIGLFATYAKPYNLTINLSMDNL
ncbi:hypothetical protein M422DRAFT_244741 [Sphaerobolus stellatus SS14]|nr:hypothetical protein M422DRAFT_244741 [Sphaerobolus stellatus SS14]